MEPFIFEAYPRCIADNKLTPVLLQEVVYETLHALCQRLPEQQAFECDSQVKTYLPKVLQHTPGSLVSSASVQATPVIVFLTSHETYYMFFGVVFYRSQKRPVQFLDFAMSKRRKLWNFPNLLPIKTHPVPQWGKSPILMCVHRKQKYIFFFKKWKVSVLVQ